MKKIQLIVLMVMISVNSFAMNFGEITVFTRYLVNDNNADPAANHFTGVRISSAVNIIQSNMMTETFPIEKISTIAIVSGQREYSLPTDTFALQRVLIDNKLLPQKSIAKLDDDNSWQVAGDSQTPTCYYVKHTTASVIGFNVIPSTTNSVIMTIQYVAMPSTLSNDSDIPFDGLTRLEPFHFGLCFGAAALLCYQDNRSADGDRYWLIYNSIVKNMDTTIRLTPDWQSGVSAISQ